jgi:hypothetical protein
MIELHFQPRGFLKRRLEVTVRGETLTTVEFENWRRRGKFELEGVAHTMERTGFAGTRARLLRGGRELARAHRPSFWLERTAIDWGDGPHSLVRRSWLSQDLLLKKHERVVATARRPRWLSWKRILECPEQIEPAVAVFLGWLVVTIDERRAAAAS